MSNRQVQKLVAIVLLVIAAVLIVGVLGMWIMHSMMGGMMNGMMGSGMMNSMSGCVLCTGGPLLLAAVLVVLGVVLLRNRNSTKGEIE
jgi:hypothetical protein